MSSRNGSCNLRRGAALATALLLAMSLGGVSSVAAQYVNLALKGTQNSRLVHEHTFTGTSKVSQPGGETYSTSQETMLRISSTFERVRRNGRMDIRGRLDRLRSDTKVNGSSVGVFDSQRSRDIDQARRDPNFDYILAALDAEWAVVLDPRGEVLDLTYEIPPDSGGAAMAPAVEGFLETIFNLGRFTLPRSAVKRGDQWQCGDVKMPFPGGRMRGQAICVLSKISNVDDERTATITVKHVASFHPDPSSGIAVELRKYEEGGVFNLALDRGVIKFIHLTGRIETAVRNNQGTMIRLTTNELIIREIR